MKPASILLFAGVAYFGIKAFAKTGAAKALQFFVSKVSLRFSGLTPILEIMLAVHNPTGENLRVGSISGQLLINGHYAADIYGYQLTDIKAFGVSYFPISARLSIYNIVSEAADIIRTVSTSGLNALANQVLGFKGVVRAEGLAIPLNFTYKVL